MEVVCCTALKSTFRHSPHLSRSAPAHVILRVARARTSRTSASLWQRRSALVAQQKAGQCRSMHELALICPIGLPYTGPGHGRCIRNGSVRGPRYRIQESSDWGCYRRDGDDERLIPQPPLPLPPPTINGQSGIDHLVGDMDATSNLDTGRATDRQAIVTAFRYTRD